MSLLLRYRKLGMAVTLRVDASELEEMAKDLHSSALEEVWDCETDTPSDLAWQPAPNGDWQILLKGKVWEGKAMPKEFLYLQSDSLLDDLARERLSDCALLHAGGVADRDSRAVVICGASGAGKTSLVLSAILQGWSWLSDELLCFRQEDPLIAEGFRRNFNLKARSFPTFPETSALEGNREFIVNDTRQQIRFLDPDALDPGRFTASARVCAFVLPEYSPAANEPIIEALSGTALVQSLAPELRTNQLRTFTWLAEVARSVPAFRLRYCSARSAAERLSGILAR